MFEIVAKRTENAKHFLMSDGTFQANIYMGAIHYQDDSGTWQNIDSTITDPVAVAIPKQPINRTLHEHGGWAHSQHFTTPYNKADLRLPKNIKSGYSIGFGQDRLTFTPDKASPSLGQINPTNPYEIDYQDVWVDTDITLEAQSDGVKETIVLKSNNSPTTFSFKVSDGTIADDWTSGGLNIVAPWYEDANGTRKDATIAQRTQGSQVFIDITVDPTGMSFPIVVDPSVTIAGNAGSGQNSSVFSGNTGTNYSTSGLNVGVYPSNTSEHWSFLVQFDLSSIPSGSSISSAILDLYWAGYNGPPSDFSLYENTGSWISTSVTWANKPATGSKVASFSYNGQAGSYASNQLIQIPITQYVSDVASGNANYGLSAIDDSTSSGYGQFQSTYTNANYCPKIEVTYDVPPSSPTVTAPNGGETINTTFNITWNAATNNSGTIEGSLVDSSENGITFYNASGYQNKVSQMFTPQSGQTSIKSVDFIMAGGSSSSSVTVAIYTVSSGAPSSQYSSVVTVTIPANSGRTKFTADFSSSPVPVTVGTQYAIVISTTDTVSKQTFYGTSVPANYGTYQHQVYGNSSWASVNGEYMLSQVNYAAPASSLTYEIDLSQNSGSTWSTIVSQTAAGATSYNYDFTNTPASSTNLIRVRAYDGSSYGPYDQSNGVFTIQHDKAPTAPTNLSPSTGALDHTQPITATWTYNDPDTGDSQSKFNIKWSTNNGSTWTEVDGTVTASTSYTWPANTFSDGQTVQWMVQTYDTNGLNSPWSAQAQFIAGTVPGTPTITSPAINATVATANPTIQWSSSGQTDYQLQVQDMSNNVLWDSGDVVSTNVAATLAGYSLANSTSYQLALRVKNSEGLWSTWTKNTINVSYTPPATATTTATADNANARIVVVIVNPAPSGSEPAVSYNDLYRRNSGTTAWTRIATELAAGTYYDYAAASNQAYDYKVTAIGANGTQTDSTIVSNVSVGQLRGLWVHDVNSPAGTVMNLQYYNASNQSADGSVPQSRQWTPAATSMQFAGRNRPVIEFGENDTFELSYKNIVMLATDAQWPILEDLIRVNKSTLCFRDGRGTMIFGCVLGYQETDLVFGNMVDLTLEQTAYSIAV